MNFSGKVNDNLKTGGMEETGKIFVKTSNNKASFDKSMLRNSIIINTRGVKKQIEKKHPTIYYNGILSNDKTENTALWFLKRILAFLLGIIPLIFRPRKGTWNINLKTITTIFLIFILSSCDTMLKVSGIIIDSKTNKPIEKVDIKRLGNNYTEKSNENGIFEYREIPGGSRDISIVVSKEEYKTDTIKIKNGEEKLIKMIKIK